MRRTERRSDDPNDQRNWGLDCAARGCGRRFEPTETVAQLAEHWNRAHVGKLPSNDEARYRRLAEAQSYELDRPITNLVWIGVGQPPRGKPNFMQ